MSERGKNVLLWALVVTLLLFQIMCLERQGEDSVRYLGRIGVLAAFTYSASHHRHMKR